MSGEPDLLIGDAERSAAALALREHYESGRLTLEELEARLDAAHTARTDADLRHALRQLPAPSRPTLRPRDTRWRSLAVQYALLNVLALLVWLFTGAQSDFWPKWMFLATLILFARRMLRGERWHRHELPPPSRERS